MGSVMEFVRNKVEKVFSSFDQQKEMGPEGPRIRMGDWLTGAVSMDMNSTVDYLLMDGYITAEERAQMASGIQGAVEAFMSAIPEEMQRRRMDYWNADPADFLDMDKSQYMFLKTKSGDLWFFGMYSNKYEDQMDDIITEDAHKEYAQWLQSSGFKPAIILNHSPRMDGPFWVKAMARYENEPNKLNALVDKIFEETMIARAERVVVWHGFTFVIGKVLPDKIELAEKAVAAGNGHMSHGFVAYHADNFSNNESSANIIGKYRSFEMSLLVGKEPANKVTQALLIGEKVMASNLSEDDRKFLSEFFSEAEISELDAKLGDGEKVLDMVLDHKEMEEGADAEEPVAEEPVAEEAVEEVTLPDAPDMFREIVKALNLDQLKEVLASINEQVTLLSDRVEGLEQLKEDVANLQKSDDEKIAAAFMPSYNWLMGVSPSQSEKTVVDEAEVEQAKQSGPQDDPAPDPDNPLMFGFYNWIGTGK
ncbi:MAG TPA: hypothetical protein PKD55_00175 [Bellilinea sp.]|nr:hypothetical protein [Bellilinea sp.]